MWKVFQSVQQNCFWIGADGLVDSGPEYSVNMLQCETQRPFPILFSSHHIPVIYMHTVTSNKSTQIKKNKEKWRHAKYKKLWLNPPLPVCHLKILSKTLLSQITYKKKTWLTGCHWVCAVPSLALMSNTLQGSIYWGFPLTSISIFGHVFGCDRSVTAHWMRLWGNTKAQGSVCSLNKAYGLHKPQC